jgi:hypothetical protein
MSDEKTDSIAFTDDQDSSQPNVAAIADKHRNKSKTGKVPKSRIKLPDGSYVSREDLASLTGKVTPKGEQESVGVNPPLSPIAKEQIVAALSSLIKVVDQRVQYTVYKTAEKISGDTKFASELKESVAMGEAESQTICSLATVVMEKYNILGTYAPEALLAVCIGGYSFRVWSTVRDLKQLKKELDQNGLPPSTTTVADNGTQRERKD